MFVYHICMYLLLILGLSVFILFHLDDSGPVFVCINTKDKIIDRSNKNGDEDNTIGDEDNRDGVEDNTDGDYDNISNANFIYIVSTISIPCYINL